MAHTDTPFTVILLAVMAIAVFRVIGANGANNKDFQNVVILFVGYIETASNAVASAFSGVMLK